MERPPVSTTAAAVTTGGAARGPVHISSPKRGWSAPGPRSVAAGFACEMGVFCGEVRLIFSVLGVFLAVEWGSKREWCEDLLIFFRKWFGDMRCFFVYYAREKSVLFGVANVIFYCYLCGAFSNRAQGCDAVLHIGVTR